MTPFSRRILITAVLALTATGCRTPEGKFQDLTVPTLAEWQQQGSVKVYDVNTDDFRAEHGKIPGAVLLNSSKDYDLSLLPAQKTDKIAFYCTSRLWTASHKAAGRAAEQGYTAVYVLNEGMKGWEKAGLPTEKIAK